MPGSGKRAFARPYVGSEEISCPQTAERQSQELLPDRKSLDATVPGRELAARKRCWRKPLTIPNIIEHDSRTYRQAPLRSTLEDLVQGLRMVDLWGTLGWLDIRQRYRRSVIGPFWVTLSLAAFVLGLGVTYGALFQMPLTDYLPYLCIGIVVWTLLSSFIIEGCVAFTGAEAAIKQVPAPLSVHVYRMVWRSVVTFLHNAVIVVLVLVFFGINPGWDGFVSLLGALIVILNGVAFALLFGTLSARFRDIPPLMGNFIQTLFFVTPVIWHADNLKERQIIAEWNPFFHLIEIVRAPLLEGIPPVGTWIIVAIFTVANIGVALLFYSRFRWRIPYWI